MKYTDFTSMPLTLTVLDICDTLAIGRNKGYELVNSGQLPALKLGSTYRVPREAFIQFIKEKTMSA